MKVIALIDGEHYPAVTRWGLASAHALGYEVVLSLLVGGTEKLDSREEVDLGPAPVERADEDPREALRRAIAEHEPDAVLDLSDEPILAYDSRMELAAVALAAGVPYLGPDFRFDPPTQEAHLSKPTIGVIGSGKRVAKTAVAAHVAKVAARLGADPVIVAMGRGGPPGPVIAGPEDVTVEALIERVERGEHAASDFLEDALMAQVPTIGARRCGGGIGGRPFVTNVAEAATLASGLGGMVILEGSGSCLPTVPWDAGVLVTRDTVPPHHLTGYLGPLRVLLTDLVVFMIGVDPDRGSQDLSTLESQLRRLRPDIRIAHAELQPVPLTDVRDKDAFFATTARPELADHLRRTLERNAGCRVVKVSTDLADRPALERDLDGSPPFDVLLTELKAAAVDVAAKRALDRGAEVVFVENRPVTAGGDGELDDLVTGVIDAARDRGQERLREQAVSR